MRWLLLFLALMLAGPALAQDDDEGRLVRFLETQLSSGTEFQVDLQGFRGALSSTASLDRLIISDSEGPWLILEQAELNWTRRALLRRQLRVNELTAERLQVLRPPVPDTTGVDLPQAEARPFSLPELPVRVEIEAVEIARVELGEPVLGIPAALSFAGNLTLADGAGDTDLEILRLDGPRGVFDLDASYENASRILDVGFLVEEDANGLVAELLSLPGRPNLRLSVEGTGPIDSFEAQIALETRDQPRLSGTVTSTGRVTDEARIIGLDVSGDISPLIQPEYRPFFGNDVGLAAMLTLHEDGRIALDDLALTSAALDLGGNLLLAGNGQPLAFDLTARVADPDGGDEIRLPVPGAEVTLGEAALVVAFDAEAGSAYAADFDLQRLRADDIRMRRLVMDLRGTIAEDDDGISAVTAALTAAAEGLDHADPDLSQAIGDSLSLSADLSWFEDAPIFLSDLSVTAGDLTMAGDAAAQFGDEALTLSLGVAAQAADLSRFAAAAGTPLSGSLDATLEGSADPLSGAFDLTLSGNGRDLRFVDGLPPELFSGRTDLTVSASRDETGLLLEDLSLDSAEITVDGSGRLTSDGGSAEADLRLRDVGLFNDVIRGPVSGRIEMSQASGTAPWTLRANLTGPAGIRASVTGDVEPDDGLVDLRANGNLPLSLANRALSPRSVIGTLNFDLRVNGAPSLQNLSGSFSTSGARVSLPMLQNSLTGVSASGRLSGGRVQVDASGALATGGRIDANGQITISSPRLPVQMSVSGSDLRLVDPTLYEARIATLGLSYSGALAGSAQVTGNILMGETEIRVPESGLGGSAAIPPIRHTGETRPERNTRAAAGLLERPAGGAGRRGGGNAAVGLDITVTAPGRIFLRGRGLDAELGGTIRIGGSAANVIPSGRFDLIRGRLSILGTRLDLTDGSVTLQGDFDPFIRLTASSRAGGYRIDINIIGPVSSPEITFSSSPPLPEDEVLAQLLFGRSVSSLSPVQLLQLADAAASLAGGSSNGGIFSNLRDNLGLDDLDLQTDDQGNAAVRAGRYLSENVYADVTVGDGDADLSLNIDLTPSITARGTLSSEGGSSLGVFFERDY